MTDRLRHAPCGCTWLMGSPDTGCQDDDCRCVTHCIPFPDDDGWMVGG